MGAAHWYRKSSLPNTPHCIWWRPEWMVVRWLQWILVELRIYLFRRWKRFSLFSLTASDGVFDFIPVRLHPSSFLHRFQAEFFLCVRTIWQYDFSFIICRGMSQWIIGTGYFPNLLPRGRGAPQTVKVKSIENIYHLFAPHCIVLRLTYSSIGQGSRCNLR